MENVEVKKAIHRYSDESRCYYLGDRNSSRFIYKYMDLEAFIVSLATASIRFVEPVQWQDKSEGRFYNASYVNVPTAKGNTPAVLASCFSYAPVNESAWRLYSHAKTGLGARCVKLKISKKLFRQEILQGNRGYALYEGLVNYSLDNFQLNNLHRRQLPNGNPNKLYNEVFDGFDLASYLSLLLVKRQAFAHEQELRYFMVPDVPDLKGSIEHEDFHIDWKTILAGIIIDENCTDTELAMLNHVLQSNGIDIAPEREFIYAMPEQHIVID